MDRSLNSTVTLSQNQCFSLSVLPAISMLKFDLRFFSFLFLFQVTLVISDVVYVLILDYLSMSVATPIVSCLIRCVVTFLKFSLTTFFFGT